MAQLIIGNLEEALVRELEERAARNGRSAEAEHREILREALRPTLPRRGFKQLLAAIPDVAEDTGYARPRDLGRKVDP